MKTCLIEIETEIFLTPPFNIILKQQSNLKSLDSTFLQKTENFKSK